MIVHLDPAHPQAALLSIPRDLFVPNARATAPTRSTPRSTEGPSQLVAAIEEDFGIPINHYVELNFDTFANVVNAVGGIDMYFPLRIFDAESGLNIERPGLLPPRRRPRAAGRPRADTSSTSSPASRHRPARWPQEPVRPRAHPPHPRVPARRRHRVLPRLGDLLTDDRIIAALPRSSPSTTGSRSPTWSTWPSRTTRTTARCDESASRPSWCPVRAVLLRGGRLRLRLVQLRAQAQAVTDSSRGELSTDTMNGDRCRTRHHQCLHPRGRGNIAGDDARERAAASGTTGGQHRRLARRREYRDRRRVLRGPRTPRRS